MNHNAVIFDYENRYIEKITDFLNLSDKFPFETRAFSIKEELEEYFKNNTVDIFIVDESLIAMADEFVYKELVILSKKSTGVNNGTYYIYKYQNVENIIREIVGFLSGSENISAIMKRKRKMSIISMYSPVKRSMATALALEVGREISKNRKVLYINLESYSGLEKRLGKIFNKDITDFLYYIESKNGNIGMLLSGIVEGYEGIDILPPARNQSDLIELPSEKWIFMLKKIEEDTDYDYVILDLSEAIQGIYGLLDLSDLVISCTDENRLSEYKISQYKDELEKTGYESILEKTKFMVIKRSFEEESCIQLENHVQTILQDLVDEK